LILGAAALVNSGCLLAAAGVAGGAAVGYAYHEGKLCQTFNACLEDTAAASRTALAELGMPVLKEQTRPGEAFLLSTTADGEKVRIYLDTRPSKFQAEGPSTRVSVRVATFGDPDVSARLLNQVAAHLVAGPVAVPAAAAPDLNVPRQVPVASPAPPVNPPQTVPPPLAN
jgi:hypothetical protein